MTTFAPCSATARTMALPMPLLPPVTMTDLPSRLMARAPRPWVSCRSAVVAPVDARGVGAVEHLVGAGGGELVPGPIDERLHAGAHAGHEGGVDAQPHHEGHGAVHLVAALAHLRHEVHG